jgi:hypothetical protein
VIDEPLRVTFMPRHELPDDDPGDRPKAGDDDDDGPEVPEDDLDVFPFDGERIDLEPHHASSSCWRFTFAPLLLRPASL